MSLYTYPHEHDGPGWAPHKVAIQDSTDPVCDMTVGQRTVYRALDLGREVLFCSMQCKARFLAAPARYRLSSVVRYASASDLTRASSVAQGAEYTCPMHPEIIRNGPGSCPICGMALEPRTPTALHEAAPEPRDLTRWFWLAAAFTLPLFIIVMSEMLGVTLLDGRTRVAMAIALATPVCVWSAWEIYVRFTQSLRNRRLNRDLISERS